MEAASFWRTGLKRLETGDLQGAQEAFDRSFQLDNSALPAFVGDTQVLARAGQLALRGFWSQARQAYAWGHKLDPGSTEPLLGLGNCLLRLQLFEPASEAFSQATRLDPNDKRAWTHLAQAQMLQGQPEAAVVSLEQADCDSLFACNLRLQVFHRLGHRLQALEAAEASLRLDFSQTRVIELWAELLHDQSMELEKHGQLEQALRNCERILQHLQWDCTLDLKTRVLLGLGREQEALAHMKGRPGWRAEELSALAQRSDPDAEFRRFCLAFEGLSLKRIDWNAWQSALQERLERVILAPEWAERRPQILSVMGRPAWGEHRLRADHLDCRHSLKALKVRFHVFPERIDVLNVESNWPEGELASALEMQVIRAALDPSDLALEWQNLGHSRAQLHGVQVLSWAEYLDIFPGLEDTDLEWKEFRRRHPGRGLTKFSDLEWSEDGTGATLTKSCYRGSLAGMKQSLHLRLEGQDWRLTGSELLEIS